MWRIKPEKVALGLSHLILASIASAQSVGQPIIDVHLHAYSADPRWNARAPNPVTNQPLNAATEAAHRAATLAQMREHNVVLAVLSTDARDASDLLERWNEAAPGRLLPAIAFEGPDDVKVDWIRTQYRAGKIRVIGEIGAPYAGYSAGNDAYERFFALAEEIDIPIAVHAGTAAGGIAYRGSPKYRMELNRPLHLEDMLVRHPKVRLQLMHAGWPFADETVALMKLHHQVYVDLGVIAWTQPRGEFHAYLRRLVNAGLGKRIMFGSDQMVWPEAIGLSIRAIEEATFLSRDQKADIFCRNAATFLKLNPSPC